MPCAQVEPVGRGRRLVAGGIEVGAFLGQGARIGEVDDAQLADLAGLAADGAVGRDMDVAVIGRDGDGAAVALHLIALAGHQIAVGVEREMAVAGVARAGRGLDREIALAGDGDIIRRAGLFDIALADVAHHAGIFHEADALRTGLALGGAHLGDVFLELRGFALETGRGDVREIVRDHVHRPISGELLRKTNKK